MKAAFTRYSVLILIFLSGCVSHKVENNSPSEGFYVFDSYIKLTYIAPDIKDVKTIVYTDDVPEYLKSWYNSKEPKTSESAAKIYLENDSAVPNR